MNTTLVVGLALTTVSLATTLAHATNHLDDPAGEVAKLHLSADDWWTKATGSCFADVAGSDGLNKVAPDVGAYEVAVEQALGLPCFGNKRGKAPRSIYYRDGDATWSWSLAVLLDEGYSSEILRASLVNGCMPRDSTGAVITSPQNNQKRGETVAIFAMCEHDIGALDQDALERELKDPRFNDFTRAKARDLFRHVKADGQALVAAYAARAKSDAPLHKLAFDVPEKTWADWTAAYTTERAAIDAAHDQTAKILADVAGRAGSHPEMSCAAEHKAIADHVAKVGVKTEGDAVAAMTDVIGSRLVEAASLCDVYAGNIVGGLTENWLNVRRGLTTGPRTATLPALAKANTGSATFKNADLPAKGSHEWMMFNNYLSNKPARVIDSEVNRQLGNTGELPAGQITAIAKVKDGVSVTFKRSTIQVPDQKCGPEYLINFDANGQPIYWADCVTTGYHTVDKSEQPIVVAAEAGAALKVGQVVQFMRSGDKTGGAPVRVWTGADQKSLIQLYGATVAITETATK
nr:hypothetical protein [Kofleriaceae bacterium]